MAWINQHKIYMGIIALVNLTFIIVGALFPVGIMNLIVVGIPKFRDTFFVLMRIFLPRFVRVDPRGGKYADTKRNVIAVIPAYKEDPDEVEDTLRSIGAQIDDCLNIGMIIVSDGFLDYHEILEDLAEVVNFEYTTYKRTKNKCTILMGWYQNIPVLVAKKSANAGKKDSLILMDDILIKPDTHLLWVRDAILKLFEMDDVQYMFHTDADSIISPSSFKRMTNILLDNPKIAAVSGMVLVPFADFKSSGYWNFFQGFQYFYGQIIRKATESMWGKTTCIPGCIAMVNCKDPAVIAACDRYNKLPSTGFIFQYKNRLQGTDRRYTNCIMQHSKDTYLVLDPGSIAYTMPPQSFNHFRSQRKRWTSNAITGNWWLIFGENIMWYTRLHAAIELFRIHTSITRFVNTIQFFANFGTIEMRQVILLLVVLVLPYLFFIYHIIPRGKYGLFLWVGGLVSKMTSPFITIYVFCYAMFYFNDIGWGATHGSQPVGDATKPATQITPANPAISPKKKNDGQGDLEMGTRRRNQDEDSSEEHGSDDDDWYSQEEVQRRRDEAKR